MFSEPVKKLFKSNPLTFWLYRKVKTVRKFFRGVSARDFLLSHKLRLILLVKPYTMLSYKRLANLYDRAHELEKSEIVGSFVECGTWNGGSAGVIAKLVKNRRIWLFDSWEGMPKPSGHDVKFKGIRGEEGIAKGSYEKVQELLFGKLKLDRDNVELRKGLFQDTVPSAKQEIGPISLLHLDCDWYESVKFCLKELYGQISPKGIIVIDDYGSWAGCKKAVDEFIVEKGLKVKLIKVDFDAVYFEKP